MSHEEIKSLSNDEVQNYIFSHAHDDEKKMLLKHKSILGIATALVAQQITARRKAEAKVPVFFKTKGIIYPPSLNLEQSSSEATARFKTQIIQTEIKKDKPIVADLTGGFGIDSFFFSNHADVVDYVEPAEELIHIVQHNMDVLKKSNIHFYRQTAESFLAGQATCYDFIYLDPSRRDTSAKKVFSLRDCSPNATLLLKEILTRTNIVLLKASPLLDIKQGLRDLTQVKKVFIVSVANECKEVLFLIEKNFYEEPLIKTFNLDNDGNIKHAFEFQLLEEEIAVSEFAIPQKYLYEPNTSILKAGAFKKVGEKFGVKKIHVNTHLYTSKELRMDFPGRVFEIEDLEVDAKSLAGKYVNIICRNYPLSPQELKKKFKTKDGGEKYMIAFSARNKKYVATAKRLA